MNNPAVQSGEFVKSTSEKNDLDIERMMESALLNDARTTDEYVLGRIEMIQEIINSGMEDAKKKMVPIAETFLNLIREFYPTVGFREVRIGLDYRSLTSTALFILSNVDEKSAFELQDWARDVETHFWKKSGVQGMIWIITSEHYDERMVKNDFPYFKADMNAETGRAPSPSST